MYTNSIRDLLPVIPQSKVITDILPKNWSSQLFDTVFKIQSYQIQLKMNGILDNLGKVKYQDDYSMFLQFPNKKLQAFALETVGVKPIDSNDTKIQKIRGWVIDNIEYKSDIENYGVPEYFALPTETLERRFADCEDGAFLIHSLSLNASVPWEKLRTYGGLVSSGINASEGGHGWTTYKRDIDNKEVAIDWCYYPTKDNISQLTPISEDKKYIDDWFYVSMGEGTIDATLKNYLRGSRINIYV